ncbi:MAG: hypothetical protein HY360_11840 [Verrucomicrobia bacterium]|nr:hypothetical protein [Verrucomicrobiota bacterium]
MARFSLLFFAVGVVSQIAQIVFLREFLRIYYGSEIAWALILGAWMFWICLGSAVASLPVIKTEKLRKWALPLLLSLAALIPATVYIIRDLRGYFDVPTGEYLSLSTLLFASLTLSAPTCFCFGALFALGSRASASPSSIYLCESLGCGVGGLACAFLFPSVDSFRAAAVLCILLLGMSFLLTKSRMMRALLAGAVPLAFWAGWKLAPLSHHNFWSNFNQQFHLVEHRASKYGDLDVVRYEGQYSLYQQGHILFSMPDQGELKPLTHLILAQHENPRTVLLIGGGAAGMLKEILRHPVARVDAVELDPAIVAVARNYIAEADRAALRDPRLLLSDGDGRRFLQRATAKYDLIIIQMPDPRTALDNRCCTLEFFQSAFARLTDKGVLALCGITSHTDYAAPEFLQRNASIFATMTRVFPEVLATPGASSTFLAARAKGTLSLDEVGVLRRLSNRMGNEMIAIFPLTEKFQVEKINAELRDDRPFNPLDERTANASVSAAALNRDRHPVACHFSMLLWMHLSNDPFAAVLKALTSLNEWLWRIPLAVCTAALIFLRLRRRARERLLAPFSLMLCVFTAGLYGITVEILAMLSFQSAFGYIHPWMGALLAIFMLGLAAGAWCHRKIANPRRGLLTLHLGLILLLGFSCVTLFPAKGGIMELLATLAVIGLDGFLVGAIYPVALRAWPQPRAGLGGLLYACDLAGGLAGALMVSSVLLPLWGSAATLQILFFLCLLSFFGCISAHRALKKCGFVPPPGG